MAFDEIFFSNYARRRMFERRVKVAEVVETLRGEDVIEDYEDGRYLTLGFAAGRSLHVVAEDDVVTASTTVIAVYEPDPALWREGFRERKR